MTTLTAARAPTASPAKVRKPFGWRFISPLLIGSSLNPINSSMIATGLVGIGLDFHKGPGDNRIPHLGPVPVQRRHAAHDGQARHDLRGAPHLPDRSEERRVGKEW